LKPSRHNDTPAAAEVVRRRAARIQRFLTQAFFVAESFTNRPGRFVPRAETVVGCRSLLDGSHDDLPPDALSMIGTLAEARSIG